MTSAIIVDKLTYGYSKHEPVLTNASFTISEGEFVAVIGPNGGGKTTLLKLLMGFYTPWSGTISIHGVQTKKYPSGIAYVPQNLRFDRKFPITVEALVLGGKLSTLSFLGRYSKEVKAQAMYALEKVGLADYASRAFGTLSGGQAQRALIARALVQDPKILLLDEPTANVDAEAEANIYDLIIQLKGHHTILMVTHDIRAIIKNVKKVLCVQGQVSVVSPDKLCEHFALGLYHYPLIDTAESHLTTETFAKTTFRI